jgi:hypothetical protein
MQVRQTASKNHLCNCRNNLRRFEPAPASGIVLNYLCAASYEDRVQLRSFERITIKERLQKTFVSACLISFAGIKVEKLELIQNHGGRICYKIASGNGK